MSAAFSLFLLHNHFITEKKIKKKSGDVNDEVKFPLFFFLHKRAKPILRVGGGMGLSSRAEVREKVREEYRV
jgi:hypothetical protein